MSIAASTNGLETPTARARRMIREELEASPDPDPYAVAEIVAKRLLAECNEADLVALLAGVLRSLIREVSNSQRVDPRDIDRERMAQSGVTNRDAWPVGPCVTPVLPSPRWERHSSLYLKLLQQRETVDEHDTKKFLGDCSVDDLEQAAIIRDKLAAGNLVAARRLRRLAQRMRTMNAATVADLPADLVEEVLLRGDD